MLVVLKVVHKVWCRRKFYNSEKTTKIFSKQFFIIRKIVREVPQKFCIAQPFSPCGNTAATKLLACVTDGIPSAHAEFRNHWLKITW